MDIDSQFLGQIRNIYASVKEECHKKAAFIGPFSSREEAESYVTELWKPVEKALSDCSKTSKLEQGFLIDTPLDGCNDKHQHASLLSRETSQAGLRYALGNPSIKAPRRGGYNRCSQSISLCNSRVPIPEQRV